MVKNNKNNNKNIVIKIGHGHTIFLVRREEFKKNSG